MLFHSCCPSVEWKNVGQKDIYFFEAEEEEGVIIIVVII